jgi:hypothetical protein
MVAVPERECTHCGQLVSPGEAHDCWTTTEAALTRDLSDDLRDAWERLRETAAGFGEQRIYASHHSIMFSRRACYCFVRPRARRLEICIFLGRTVVAPQVRRVHAVSRVKVAHVVHVRHRDEVEAPITDWMREAYDVSEALGARPAPAASPARKTAPAGRAAGRAATREGRKAGTKGRQEAAPASAAGRAPGHRAAVRKTTSRRGTARAKEAGSAGRRARKKRSA